eukprot:jgi/Hompol1/828/HPOL_002576-RA
MRFDPHKAKATRQWKKKHGVNQQQQQQQQEQPEDAAEAHDEGSDGQWVRRRPVQSNHSKYELPENGSDNDDNNDDHDDLVDPYNDGASASAFQSAFSGSEQPHVTKGDNGYESEMQGHAATGFQFLSERIADSAAAAASASAAAATAHGQALFAVDWHPVRVALDSLHVQSSIDDHAHDLDSHNLAVPGSRREMLLERYGDMMPAAKWSRPHHATFELVDQHSAFSVGHNVAFEPLSLPFVLPDPLHTESATKLPIERNENDDTNLIGAVPEMVSDLAGDSDADADLDVSLDGHLADASTPSAKTFQPTSSAAIQRDQDHTLNSTLPQTSDDLDIDDLLASTPAPGFLSSRSKAAPLPSILPQRDAPAMPSTGLADHQSGDINDWLDDILN